MSQPHDALLNEAELEVAIMAARLYAPGFGREWRDSARQPCPGLAVATRRGQGISMDGRDRAVHDVQRVVEAEIIRQYGVEQLQAYLTILNEDPQRVAALLEAVLARYRVSRRTQ